MFGVFVKLLLTAMAVYVFSWLGLSGTFMRPLGLRRDGDIQGGEVFTILVGVFSMVLGLVAVLGIIWIINI